MACQFMRLGLLGFPFYGSRQQAFVLCVLWEKVLHCVPDAQVGEGCAHICRISEFSQYRWVSDTFIGPGLEL